MGHVLSRPAQCQTVEAPNSQEGETLIIEVLTDCLEPLRIRRGNFISITRRAEIYPEVPSAVVCKGRVMFCTASVFDVRRFRLKSLCAQACSCFGDGVDIVGPVSYD